MRMLLFAILFSLTACGRVGSGIKIQMDPIYAAATYMSVNKLQNATQNKEVMYNSKDPAIIIEYATDEALKAQYGRYVMGLATIMWNQPCRIQISDRTFVWGQEWMDSVLWHEIGHCLGLEHVDDSNDLMYKYANPFSWYTATAIDQFLRRLYEATH